MSTTNSFTASCDFSLSTAIHMLIVYILSYSPLLILKLHKHLYYLSVVDRSFFGAKLLPVL